MLARRDLRKIEKRALPVFWPATLAELHLKRLHKAGFDPFDARVQEAPSTRLWRLLGARLLGRF